MLLAILALANNRQELAVAKDCRPKKVEGPAKIVSIHRPLWAPNRIGNYFSNDGQMVTHVVASGPGMEWPVGSGKTINFASGIRLAGIKDGAVVSAAAEYITEFQPGKVTGWSPGLAGAPADPNDPAYRVYIINRLDYDQPFENPDYVNWPAADGAPTDAQGRPLVIGTSTVWTVFNDFAQLLHDHLYQSKIMGVEAQMTAWALDLQNAFGDMMFFRFKIINKSGKDVQDTYVAFWADCDIGVPYDLVGCDTTRSLGYMYKARSDEQYGDNPPAIGYELLQGPIVPSPGDTADVSGRKRPDFKNLPMTAFAKYT
jgi:hypothetical protein